MIVAPKPLCRRYTEGESSHENGLTFGRYLAAVDRSKLPPKIRTDDRVIRHGWAVGFGEWVFFDDLEPAVAFGRAVRMSIDCHGYGVYRAAHETVHCWEYHNRDERVLHLVGESVDRQDGEADVLDRFAQGVRQAPGSARWVPPTSRTSRAASTARPR